MIYTIIPKKKLYTKGFKFMNVHNGSIFGEGC